MNSDDPSSSRTLRVRATSRADEAGYLGQFAVAQAAGPTTNYRLVGGHMVRLLLAAFPTTDAVPRTTLDADAAFGSAEVIGSVAKGLISDGFAQLAGNVFTKPAGSGVSIEINVLASREDPRAGVKPFAVPDVGQVDTLPELSLALAAPALVLDIRAILLDGREIHYVVLVPDVEMAVILKAHSWAGRRAQKDVADLATLLEIRHEHPEVAWSLDGPQLRGRRLDTAQILHHLADMTARATFLLPAGLGRARRGGDRARAEHRGLCGGRRPRGSAGRPRWRLADRMARRRPARLSCGVTAASTHPTSRQNGCPSGSPIT